MEKEEHNYSSAPQQEHDEIEKKSGVMMVDYMVHNEQISSCNNNNNLSFADVMQFADFGPKLGSQDIDPVYFLKFPVLNDKSSLDDEDQTTWVEDKLNFDMAMDMDKKNNTAEGGKNKRKRPRTVKTSEEVESQRMTHIAVERNRRKQMNEHLRVLRSLMPGSYVQRGDQASIIGGAIEFVRELEQLLQCLESQKRRRLYGESTNIQAGDQSTIPPPLLFPDQQVLAETGGVEEETAENKSCLADIEVKLLGFDAIIKILSRRRPGQLVKTIAALQDLHLNILHTNITTIEQTVLYSFNVKIGTEMRFTAQEIASSVQQIFSFIHANTGM